MIFIYYIIIDRSVGGENLASVVHKLLFYKLSSIFLLCVGEFEFYIKWYIVVWSVGDRDLVNVVHWVLFLIFSICFEYYERNRDYIKRDCPIFVRQPLSKCIIIFENVI